MPNMRLSYFQISRVEVVNMRDDFPVSYSLYSVGVDALDGKNAPDGCFIAHSKGVYVPKKKRGDKYRIVYTTLNEIVR